MGTNHLILEAVDLCCSQKNQTTLATTSLKVPVPTRGHNSLVTYRNVLLLLENVWFWQKHFPLNATIYISTSPCHHYLFESYFSEGYSVWRLYLWYAPLRIHCHSLSFFCCNAFRFCFWCFSYEAFCVNHMHRCEPVLLAHISLMFQTINQCFLGILV